MPKTFTFTAARDGDTFSEDFICEHEEEAQALALAAINTAWRKEYPDYEEMTWDVDGIELQEWPAVMAERIPLATLTAYRRLHDGLNDMIENERLNDEIIPDDYRWLVGQLTLIAGLDAGPVALPPHMEAGA